MLTFWKVIDAQLDTIGAQPADTFDKVRDALNDHHGCNEAHNLNPDGTDHPDRSFFAGSGGDRTLNGALSLAGWECSWAEANYYWEATHTATGEILTYIEGDVIRGAHK